MRELTLGSPSEVLRGGLIAASSLEEGREVCQLRAAHSGSEQVSAGWNGTPHGEAIIKTRGR